MVLLADGWIKFTLALLPTLKLSQFSTALLLPWFTVNTPGVWLMRAWPATTVPPVGNWVGTGPAACAMPAPSRARVSACKGKRAPGATCGPLRLPPALAFSATATKVPVMSFQMLR